MTSVDAELSLDADLSLSYIIVYREQDSLHLYNIEIISYYNLPPLNMTEPN